MISQALSQRCPICNEGAKQLEQVPVVFNYGSVHTLRKCTSCESSYFAPLPSLANLITFYSTHGYDFNPHSAAHRARAIVRAHLSTDRKGRFIDIGCATGFLLKEVERLSGWDVYGVEISEKATRFAQERLGLTNVSQKDLLSAGFPEGFFDVVHISEVLEHVPNPLEILKECRRILKPEGSFLLSLPNGLADRQGLLDYWARHKEAPGHGSGHIFFFSEQGLRRLAHQAGFDIIEGETYAFKQGLRSLGLFPKRPGWQSMFEPRREPEKPVTSEITMPPQKHSDFYYRLKYGLRGMAAVSGLQRFGLGWHLLLKPAKSDSA
jgi:2-polyprenyl-3-methyl-5-hydroxy-6-metoxy-1,4-benzoquinol methylase